MTGEPTTAPEAAEAPRWRGNDSYLRIEALQASVKVTEAALNNGRPVGGTVVELAQRYLAFLRGDG